MGRRNLLFFLLATGIVLLVFFYVFSDAQVQDDYAAQIDAFRARSETALVEAEDSPFSDSIPYRGLEYYPIDPNYKVTATVRAFDDFRTLHLATNDGDDRTYVRFGELSFTLKGKPQTMILLQEQKDPTQFFLPFKDPTNDNGSYGAGRYLPITYDFSTTLELDFNLAFNPYCAYNPAYSCPLPPKENHLTVAIEAGEQAPKGPVHK